MEGEGCWLHRTTLWLGSMLASELVGRKCRITEVCIWTKYRFLGCTVPLDRQFNKEVFDLCLVFVAGVIPLVLWKDRVICGLVNGFVSIAVFAALGPDAPIQEQFVSNMSYSALLVTSMKPIRRPLYQRLC